MSESAKIVQDNKFVTIWEFKGMRIVGHRLENNADGYLFFAVYEPVFAGQELSRFHTLGAAKKFISGRVEV